MGGAWGDQAFCSSQCGLGLPVTGNASESVLQFVMCSLGAIQHLHCPTNASAHGASPDFHCWRNYQVAVCDEKFENRDLFEPK